MKESNKITSEEEKDEIDITHELEEPIKEYKKTIESKNNEIKELKKKLSNFEIDNKKELEVQAEYLNSMVEGYKKNIENMKEQKIKEANDFKEQIEKLEIEIVDYKVRLATIQFEMDRKLVIYKKYVNKLQNKLESVGFKFKEKKSIKNNKMPYV